MRLFYISDLHLKQEKEKNSLRLLSFLQAVPQPNDILVLGGDIFDLFIGNKKAFQKKFKNILGAINALSQRGCSVYYLEGNHDFHLDEVFSIESGVMVKSDDFFLEFEGKKVWVSHGDLIDEEDRGYRLLRATTRHPTIRGLIDIIPGAVIDGIGNWSSRQSRKYNNPTAAGLVGQKRTRNLFRKYAEEKVRQGFDFVLIGHSHLEEDQKIEFEGKSGQYVNLGFSREALLYGVLADDAKTMELKSIS